MTRGPPIEIILATLAVLLPVAAALAIAPQILDILPRCPWFAWTGHPCPTCGLTRAAHALLGGDLQTAFYHQPLGVASLVLVPALALARAVSTRISPGRTSARVLSQAVATMTNAPVLGTLVFANWAYLLAALPTN